MYSTIQAYDARIMGGGNLDLPFFYLAGPMTGYEEYNFPAFNLAADRLRDQGYNLINPAQLDHEVEAKFEAKPPQVGVLEYDDSWRECLRRDLLVVGDENCQGVICIEGWEKSRGARLETYVAAALELPIYLLDGLSLTEIDRGAALREAGVVE